MKKSASTVRSVNVVDRPNLNFCLRKTTFVSAVCFGTLVGLGAMLSSTVKAESISQDLTFLLNSTNSAATLNFAPFDSNQGLLESVQFTFTATRRHDWALWNSSSEANAVAFVASLAGSSVTLGGEMFAFPDFASGFGSTPLLAPTSASVFIGEFLAGRAQFLAGATPEFPSAFHSSTDSLIDGSGGLPLSFDGNLAISFVPGAWAMAATNVFSSSFVDVEGTVTATYNYRATPVPDSLPGGALAATLVGLILTAKLSRSKMSERETTG